MCKILVPTVGALIRPCGAPSPGRGGRLSAADSPWCGDFAGAFRRAVGDARPYGVDGSAILIVGDGVLDVPLPRFLTY